MSCWIIRVFILSVCLFSFLHSKSLITWLKRDNYSYVRKYLLKISESDCKSNSKGEMVLHKDIVTQIPKYNELLTKNFYKNRSSLVQLHNMALNRAMFYSYILQKMNDSNSFFIQPDWNYMFMSTTADVNANAGIFNASAIYFDTHCHYPNWYSTVDFNKTLELFGPKAYRIDDTFDMDNFLRENTDRSTIVRDMGSGHDHNYTHDIYKMNPWYNFWLPDTSPSEDSVKKFTYSINIKYSNETGKFTKNEYDTYNFFGPNSPGISEKDEGKLPVRFTRPYFDCGVSHKWVVSAVAPIVDYMPRYLNWTHLRRQRFVGVVVIDTYFRKLDFNPCGVSIGNPGPSHFAGINRCKQETTRCEFKRRKGFGRGSYTCDCRPGYHYPTYIKGPFIGRDVEKAIDSEYRQGFDCIKTDHQQVIPIVSSLEERYRYNQTRSRRDISAKSNDFQTLEQKNQFNQFLQNVFKEDIYTKDSMHQRSKRSTDFDSSPYNKMMGIFKQISLVNKHNCQMMPRSYKELPGDVAYGVEEQFDNQARAALRLSHFLSNYYQNVVPGENFGDLKGGNRLHIEHLFGEVFANVIADPKILSSGLYYEPYEFENVDGTRREYFGPWGFRKEGEYFVLDSAGLQTRYTDENWYRPISERWKTNMHGLLKYSMKSLIRSDPNGTSTVKHEYYPITYSAPSVDHGVWSRPVFKCDGNVDRWSMTYAVPFIGLDDLRRNLKFKGVVTVEVPLDQLEINQCSQPFHVSNAFKNTARCDYKTTDCTPLEGYKFERGAYKCTCKMGYEYPWKDGREWYMGSYIEKEYEKKKKGLFSIYDGLKCRVSMGSTSKFSLSVVTLAVITSLSMQALGGNIFLRDYL